MNKWSAYAHLFFVGYYTMYCGLEVAKNSACPSINWPSLIYEKLHRDSMSFINIGANSGSNVNEFLLKHDPKWNVTPALWHEAAGTGCGVCKACRTTVAKGTRPISHVHIIALEMMTVNYDRLQFVFEKFGVPGIAIHAAGGSYNGITYEPKLKKSKVGIEYMGIKDGKNTDSPVPMLTVDAVMTMLPSRHTNEVDVLSIDTEGNDANVLKGAMYGISQRKFRIIEFEYHGVGDWQHTSIKDTVKSLMQHKYVCFWQGNKLARFQIECDYEFKRWSNLVCSHEIDIINIFEKHTRSGIFSKIKKTDRSR